jgi:hypothetical protein
MCMLTATFKINRREDHYYAVKNFMHHTASSSHPRAHTQMKTNNSVNLRDDNGGEITTCWPEGKGI